MLAARYRSTSDGVLSLFAQHQLCRLLGYERGVSTRVVRLIMIQNTFQADARDVTQVLEDCRRGCSSAWAELIARFGRLVYSIPRQYGLPEADADDVFQNVFQQLHRRLDSIREPNRLSGWLATAAHRECWRISRARGRTSAISDRWCDPHEPPPELAARWELQHIVRDSVNQLPARDRDLLTALFLAPELGDYCTVAKQLGIRPGSIGPTRARAFEKLERILKGSGIDAHRVAPDVAPCPRASHSRTSNGSRTGAGSNFHFRRASGLSHTSERSCA